MKPVYVVCESNVFEGICIFNIILQSCYSCVYFLFQTGTSSAETDSGYKQWWQYLEDVGSTWWWHHHDWGGAYRLGVWVWFPPIVSLYNKKTYVMETLSNCMSSLTGVMIWVHFKGKMKCEIISVCRRNSFKSFKLNSTSTG